MKYGAEQKFSHNFFTVCDQLIEKCDQVFRSTKFYLSSTVQLNLPYSHEITSASTTGLLMTSLHCNVSNTTKENLSHTNNYK